MNINYLGSKINMPYNGFNQSFQKIKKITKVFSLFLFTSLMFTVGLSAQVNRKDTKKSIPYKANCQRMASSSSAYHTLEIRNGELWAWGRNTFGQLGDETTIEKSAAVRVGSDDKWISVAAGNSHSLGLKADGTLWAWGNNSHGQRGNGAINASFTNPYPVTPITVPYQVGTDSDWVSIAAGYEHSLALKVDGTLWAWGSNNFGQLGIDALLDLDRPTIVGGSSALHDWTSVAAGDFHTVGMRSLTQANAGSLWAWGLNSSGQLGVGDTNNRAVPTQVAWVDRYWVSFSAGANHTLAVRSNGTLWVWGNNKSGQLGDGGTTNINSPLQEISMSHSWTSVAAGNSHSLALKADGTLWSWGNNDYGQLGNGGLEMTERIPVPIGKDNTWVGISAGHSHSLGLKADGILKSWGYDNYGQVGDGGELDKNKQIPVQISKIDIPKWISISIKAKHSLGLKSDGTIWEWNNNSAPQPIGKDRDWVSIAAGEFHSLGLKADGSLWSWGSDTYGQLGDGVTIANQISPVKVGINNSWVSIAAGSFHSLGLTSDGTLWAWGFNEDGQLGDEGFGNQYVPMQMKSRISSFSTDTERVSTWVSVTAGTSHTLAIKSDGSLWACGRNTQNQIAIFDSTTKRNSLSKISAWGNIWVNVAGGLGHSVGLRANGELWTWGWNQDGQLGNDSTASIADLVNLNKSFFSVRNWLDIAAGNYSTFGIKADGTLWAWGFNGQGQLGTSSDLVGRPMQVGVDKDWISIKSGDTQTLGLRANGDLYKWGDSVLSPVLIP
ncbi:MAG: chromosome condensation regulator RCC1 [Flavobacterium sp.]|nr:chromosome condensation regulator RCC1 [Flavobacterium sp.]